MPVAELECEICGRRGAVIPCTNSEWCQNGRCLKCHTSILGQTKYYSVAYDIVLTCESCVANGEGCIVNADQVEALLNPRDASLAQPAAAVTEQQKRLRPTDESPQHKRQRTAASQAASPKDTGKAPAARKQTGKDTPSGEVQQSQPQPSPTANRAQLQPSKATPPKRPAVATGLAADGPPVKRPTVHSDTVGQKAQKQIAKDTTKKTPQEQARGLGVLKQQQQQQHKQGVRAVDQESSRRGAAATATAGIERPVVAATKGSGAGGSQAAAALAISQMRGSSSQPSANSGSKSQSHSMGMQQPPQVPKSKAAAEAVADTQQQSHQRYGVSGSQRGATSAKAGSDKQHLPNNPGQDAASAAAALVSKAAAAKLAQRSLDSSSHGTHGKSQDSGQQRLFGGKAAPGARGVGEQGKQQLQQQRQPAAAAGRADNNSPVRAEASKWSVASSAAGVDNISHKPDMGEHQRPLGTGQSSDLYNRQPGGIRPADADAMRRRAEKRIQSAEPKFLPDATGVTNGFEDEPTVGQQRPRLKPFSVMGIRVGEDPSEDFDEANTVAEPLEEHVPNAIQSQTSLRATHSVCHRGSNQAQNTDWVGRASIELDDMVDMDIRITPVADIALPGLLGSLKAHQDSHIDGGLVTRAVMDRRAQKERSQGSDVELTANFSKALVTLKERALGQGKHMHTLIKKMVESRKFLKLHSDSHSIFFGPMSKGQLAEANKMELVDYTVMFDKHYDTFEQVYNDRLGLIYHLAPGEELPSCKTVQFTEGQAGAHKATGWNKKQTAKKSNLKKESSQPMDPLRPTLSFEVADVAATATTIAPSTADAGICHEDEHDDWLGDTEFAGFGGTGMADASAGLATGMSGAHSGVSGFMAHEDSQVPHVGYVGASAVSGLGSAFKEILPQVGSAALPLVGGGPKLGGHASPNNAIQPLYRGLDTVGMSGVTIERLQMSSISGQHASGIGVTPGTSPTTPEQQLPPAPLGALERQISFAEHGLIPNILRSERPWPKHKLMPSVEGLCNWLHEHRMEGLKVHIDKTLVVGDPQKAHALGAWMRTQGATVTAHPCAPSPGEVNLLVVRKHDVLANGMEGTSSSVAINQHLVQGMHVVSESFIDRLQSNNLRPEIFGATRHSHFFASGVTLLWDKTLIKHSLIDDLSELLRSLRKVALCMGPSGGSYKAFACAWSNEYMGHMQHMDKWMKDGMIEDLPRDYISKSARPGLPQALQDAIKAIFLMNNRNEAVRYMIVVVPNATDKLSIGDVGHVESVLRAASDQKTVFAATLSDTIKFLHLLSTPGHAK